MYSQSRLESLIESVFNIGVGFFIALGAQVVVFPWFGVHVPFSTNLNLVLIFTVISVVRSYVVRRWFNAGLHRLAATLARNLWSTVIVRCAGIATRCSNAIRWP